MRKSIFLLLSPGFLFLLLREPETSQNPWLRAVALPLFFFVMTLRGTKSKIFPTSRGLISTRDKKSKVYARWKKKRQGDTLTESRLWLVRNWAVNQGGCIKHLREINLLKHASCITHKLYFTITKDLDIVLFYFCAHFIALGHYHQLQLSNFPI